MRGMESISFAASEPSVPTVDPAVVRQIHAELVALRKNHGQLSITKLAESPLLVDICGEGDLIEAFMVFRRELERFTHSDKYEAAAALSISSPADTVLERLTITAEHFDYQDQRTIRRWSDKGLLRIAENLVAIANVRGRLGKELLTLTLEGSLSTGLQLVIDQMDFTDLPSSAPSISIWAWQDEDNASELHLDLNQEASRSAENSTYRNQRHRIAMSSEHLRRTTPGRLLTVTIQGRSAPSRTVVWAQEAELPPELQVELTVHRTMVMVEISRRETRL